MPAILAVLTVSNTTPIRKPAEWALCTGDQAVSLKRAKQQPRCHPASQHRLLKPTNQQESGDIQEEMGRVSVCEMGREVAPWLGPERDGSVQDQAVRDRSEDQIDADRREGEGDRPAVEAFFLQIAQSISALSPRASSAEVRRSAQSLWGGVHGITVPASTGKLAIGGDAPAEVLTAELIGRYLEGMIQTKSGGNRPSRCFPLIDHGKLVKPAGRGRTG